MESPLHEWIIENGVTQVWLGEQIDEPQSIISNWIKRNRVAPKKVRKVSDFTGIKPHLLNPDTHWE